ncbi:MAG: hypothetical protein ACRCVT_13965 [Leadbetterella sp.]
MPNQISILGSGWLGLPLAIELHNLGSDVFCSYRSLETQNNILHHNLKPIELEVRTDMKVVPIFFESETLVICYPPRLRQRDESDFLEEADSLCTIISESTHIKHIVYISSTSVYANAFGSYIESDALDDHPIRKVEKKIEALASFEKSVCILRMGGLMGGNRNACKYLHPEMEKLHHTVNYVHQTDAIEAVKKVITEKRVGIYNIVSPAHPSRAEILKFYCGQPDIEIQEYALSKVVDSRLFILDTGFSYQYPNPLNYPQA